MKKIYKYIRNAETPSLQEELKKYTELSQAFRKQPNRKIGKKQSPLALIIPFAAASLSPFAVNAQCGAAQAAGPGIGNGAHILVDIDNNGSTDIEIDVTLSASNDLYVIGVGGAQIMGYGGFNYGSRLNAGAAIDTYATNWISPSPFGILDYNGTAGPWSGPGTVSGYLAVKVGSQLGFINISWTHSTGTVSVDESLSGLQTVAMSTGAGSSVVEAGDCLSLPVEIIRFSGNMRSNYAELLWTTASERDNKGFEVQRSTNGVIFETIGFVEGQGNSDTKIDYNFNDETVRPGVNYYYRLNAINYWGNGEKSNVINLQSLEGPATRLVVAPNPALDYVDVQYHSESNEVAELSVFDAIGKLVINRKLYPNDKTNFQLDISELPSGNYFMKVQEPHVVEYKQFIKG